MNASSAAVVVLSEDGAATTSNGAPAPNRNTDAVAHDDDDNDTVLSAGPPPPSTMRICLWAICILGIVLNLIVFHRNSYSRKRQNCSVRNSLQLLCFMAAADTISLAALMLALSTQYLGIENHITVAAICKVDLFLIHASSAFSIWCWLVLSAMRYLAVYRPYSHLKLNKEPIFTTCMIFVMCCVLELWILYDVTFIKEMKICGETLPEKWGKSFQLAEIIWSYFLPLTLITVLDIKVLFCHSTWSSKGRRNSPTDIPTLCSVDNINKNLAKTFENVSSVTSIAPLMDQTSAAAKKPRCQSPLGQVVETLKSKYLKKNTPSSSKSSSRTSSRRRTQQMRILRRCLCISILDLGMNLPNYLVRLYLTLIGDEQLEEVSNTIVFLWIQDISQLLYFAQFSLNALYLVCIIYVSGNRSIKKRGSHNQQLHSMSQNQQCGASPSSNGRSTRSDIGNIY